MIPINETEIRLRGAAAKEIAPLRSVASLDLLRIGASGDCCPQGGMDLPLWVHPWPLRGVTVRGPEFIGLSRQEEYQVYWENEHFKYFGHKAGDLKRAARKQHAPETCWATCLAMAAALLGVQDWDNEFKWFRTAKAAELTESSGRITEQNFVTLAGGIKALKMAVYAKGDFADRMAPSLGESHVLLLWSAEHSVVLGLIQADREGPPNPTYYVLDPSSGAVEEWSLDKVTKFTYEYVVDIKK